MKGRKGSKWISKKKGGKEAREGKILGKARKVFLAQLDLPFAWKIPISCRNARFLPPVLHLRADSSSGLAELFHKI